MYTFTFFTFVRIRSTYLGFVLKKTTCSIVFNAVVISSVSKNLKYLFPELITISYFCFKKIIWNNFDTNWFYCKNYYSKCYKFVWFSCLKIFREVAERLKARAWKVRIQSNLYRGFESLPLCIFFYKKLISCRFLY